MATTNHEQVGKVLTLVRDTILPELERTWRAHFGKAWIKKVSHQINYWKDVASPDDLIFLLKGMDATWNLFRNTHSRRTRSYLHLLWEARNEWAHNKRFSYEETFRILDHCEMLLNAFRATKEAEKVRDLKLGLRKAGQKPGIVNPDPPLTRRPTGIRLWEEQRAVRSGIEVLERVLEALYKKYGKNLVYRYPHVSYNRTDFSRPRQVGSTDLYMNRNLPIDEIIKRAYRVLSIFGHPPSDLEILYD